MPLGQPFDGGDVGVGEIADMHVVADAGAVGRRIVVAENVDRRLAAHGGEQDQRNEVGFGVVALPDLAVRVGACRVEVAQRHMPDAARRFGIPQHPLDHELGDSRKG